MKLLGDQIVQQSLWLLLGLIDLFASLGTQTLVVVRP